MTTKFSIYVSYNLLQDAVYLNIALTELEESTILRRTHFAQKLITPEVFETGQNQAGLVRGVVDKDELLAKLREFCNQIEQHWSKGTPAP